MLGKGGLISHEQVIGEKIEFPLCCDRGIEHANRSRRGIPRIYKNLSADLLLLAVHRFERLARHDDFAAYLKIALELGFLKRAFFHAQRNGANGFYVECYVLARRAVAARNPAKEHPVLVKERNAQAVEFVFGDVFDLFAAAAFAYATVKIAQRIERERIVEAEHRPCVANGLKAFARLCSHACSR